MKTVIQNITGPVLNLATSSWQLVETDSETFHGIIKSFREERGRNPGFQGLPILSSNMAGIEGFITDLQERPDGLWGYIQWGRQKPGLN